MDEFLRQRLSLVIVLVSPLATTGCASIVNGTSQPVSVVAKTAENGDVMGARCTLTNSKGEWFTTTPGSVVVHRSYGDMAVNCVHPKYAGVTTVKSTTKGMAFGNIFFGGVIGAGIDMGNGSAYDYPDMISVPMTGIGPVRVEDAAFFPKATLSPVATEVVPTTGALETPPIQPKPAAGVKPGNDLFIAERLAKSQACHQEPHAILTAKGPGFESYSVACENGDALAVRCEFGNCRVLR